MAELTETLRIMGPVVAAVWLATVVLTLWRPQRYFNSILLMVSLLVTMVFVASLFGPGRSGYVLLGFFLLVMLGLFLTPVLLVVNGIQMIRRESVCPAHLLSLALGIVVGVGEIASVVFVLGLAEVIPVSFAPSRLLLWVALTVFYFSALVLCFVAYALFIQIMPRRMQFDYVIIHGCGLKADGTPTKLLADRIDRAIRIYEKCKVKPVIIPSGGQGSDEKQSEAAAMTDYLLAHGVDGGHILPEDGSATTRENLRNSKALIDSRGGGRTALISSNYHIYRCLCLAREEKLKCTGIGAPVALYYWPSALIREFIAVLVTKRFLPWAIIGYLLFISPLLLGLLR